MNGRTNSNPSSTVTDVTKSPFATLPPSNITAVRGNQKIDLGWTNPVTEMATPGDYVVAKRAYTLVLRNEDHFPIDRNDGIEIYRDTNTEDSSNITYSDSGLINGKNYYYGLISITDNEIPSKVGTTENVPSGGLLHTGLIEPLTTGTYWMGYDNPAIAVADNTYAIITIRNASGGFDDNVNAYNSALVKTLIPLEELDWPNYNGYGDFVGQSAGPYGVFFGAIGKYNNNWVYYRTMFAYDKNLTVNKFVHTANDLTGIDPVTAPVNNGALFYSSRSSTSVYNSLWDYVNSNLTLSSPNISTERRSTTGLTTLNSIIALAPGYADTVYSGNEAGKVMDIITKNLTKLSTVNVSAPADNSDVFLASTKNHIIYAPGFSSDDLDLRSKVYAYTENLTETIVGDLPSSFNDAGNYQRGVSFGEYAVLFTYPELVCAYDQFLTQSIPAKPNVDAIATGVINNHLLIATRDEPYDVDVYSL